MRNYLKREINKAKSLGFTMAYNAKNPTMRLSNGWTLVWLAGELISIVTTKTFFGGHWHLVCWKSSDKNKPYATMTSTQLCDDGITKQTLIYYREINKPIIIQLSSYFKCPETNIVIDHINHRRGCNYDENLRPATIHQNNQNKSKSKIQAAFYTVDEIVKMLKNNEIEPMDKAIKLKYKK